MEHSILSSMWKHLHKHMYHPPLPTWLPVRAVLWIPTHQASPWLDIAIGNKTQIYGILLDFAKVPLPHKGFLSKLAFYGRTKNTQKQLFSSHRKKTFNLSYGSLLMSPSYITKSLLKLTATSSNLNWSNNKHGPTNGKWDVPLLNLCSFLITNKTKPKIFLYSVFGVPFSTVSSLPYLEVK